MLLAMFLGMGFYAGFIVDSNNMPVIAKQLHRMMTHGLLDRRQTGPPLTIHCARGCSRRRRFRSRVAEIDGVMTFALVSCLRNRLTFLEEKNSFSRETPDSSLGDR